MRTEGGVANTASLSAKFQGSGAALAKATVRRRHESMVDELDDDMPMLRAEDDTIVRRVAVLLWRVPSQ